MSLPIGYSGDARVPNADECAELFHRLQPRLQRILGRFQVPHQDAEDLLQEAFVLYLLRSHVRDPEAWLIGTIRKRCIVHWRRRSLRASLLEPLRPEDLTGFGRPARSGVALDDRLKLKEALARLSLRDRRLLWLRYVVECSGGEIADALGIAPQSIRKLLLRARERLRRVLADPTYTPQNTTQSHPQAARRPLG
jgi:RNA polymerase sigma factor (sigma-70 family)